MVSMKQPGVPYGTTIKTIKGSDSSDHTGERKEHTKAGVGMGEADRHGTQANGVGRPGHMGKQDGKIGEFNSGKSESTVYEHKRHPHHQDEM